MRSRATGRSMAVGTAFVGGTSLALAPLRVFLLDAEDEMGEITDGSFLKWVVWGGNADETGRVWSFVSENGRHICLYNL